ncbi:MAG: HK97 family phage prohead protease [Marivivens sp.]|nr:HK97 family phage prohead protease [Marivivens sp.]
MPIPTDAMAEEAQRGLEWRREYGRGGTQVGVARARDIANKRDLSMDTVRRMNSYFARHEVDKDAEGFRPGEDGYPSAGRIAWALWGGDAGQSWAARLVAQDDEDRAETRPYEGEHAARIRDPEGFDSFRRVNGEGGQGVDFVYGITDGEAQVQSIRFKIDFFTEDQAREWLESNDFEPLLFEPAAPIDDSRASVVSLPQKLEAPKMAEAEIRALNAPLELREEDDGLIRVAGYAAVFNEETNIGGYFTETIAPGAFTSALDRGDDVVLLVNHDGLPLARTRSGTLRLTQDERGLYIESELDPSDPDVRAIVPKMKRGDLDKMSFAFIPTRQSWDDSGDMPKRMIEDLQLFDVAIVTTPAYDGTEIGLRSLQKYRDEQQKSQAARRLRMKARLTE